MCCSVECYNNYIDKVLDARNATRVTGTGTY